MSEKQLLSHAFCSINRQKPPTWSNRFRKDVNDLMYYPKDLRDIQYIKKSYKSLTNLVDGQQTSYNIKQKRPLNRLQLRQTQSSFNKPQQLRRTMSTQVSLRNTSRSLKKQQSYKEQNPEQQKQTINQKILSSQFVQKINNNFMISRSNSVPCISAKIQSQIKTQTKYGLSPFQFSTKTIEGKINSKQSHNLDMAKSNTQKVTFLYPVYYNTEKDISLKQYQKKKAADKLKKYRDFKNYESHKLFEDIKKGVKSGVVDKFYDVSAQKYDAIRKKLRLTIDFQKISPRPQIPQKLGTNLEYPNSYRELAASNISRPQYEIQKSQRQVLFPPQVISDKVGCRR